MRRTAGLVLGTATGAALLVAVKLGTSAAAPGSVGGGDGGVAAVVVGGPTPTGSAGPSGSPGPHASGSAAPHPSGSASPSAPRPSGSPAPGHTTARPTPTPTPGGGSGYRDGTYRATATVRYRESYPITLTVTITGGRIADITAAYQAPELESKRKSDHACPILRTEALQAQSADIHTVSGATDTSEAYITALAAVLAAA